MRNVRHGEINSLPKGTMHQNSTLSTTMSPTLSVEANAEKSESPKKQQGFFSLDTHEIYEKYQLTKQSNVCLESKYE
jgi:hypothetical protein